MNLIGSGSALGMGPVLGSLNLKLGPVTFNIHNTALDNVEKFKISNQ